MFLTFFGSFDVFMHVFLECFFYKSVKNMFFYVLTSMVKNTSSKTYVIIKSISVNVLVRN